MLIHGVHSLESDAELIQKHKAHLVHNPTSNANNRIGMLSNQAAERMKPGLGTDGLQSNMIREAKEGILSRSSHMSAGDAGFDYQAILITIPVLPLPFSDALWVGLSRVIVQISQFMITILEPRFIPIMSLDMFSLDWANHVMS